jgi:outer membrane protein assembly factor BamA
MPRPLPVAVALVFACGCGAGRAPTTSTSPRPNATVETAHGRAVRWRGGEFRLAAIEFEGNAHAPDAELLATMLLPRRDEIDDDLLRRDEMWIAAWYYDRGYVMVKVEPIVLVRDELGDELRARVVVHEGPVFSVRRFEVYEEGEGGARAPLSVAWTRPAVEGRPFRRSTFASVLAELRERYQDRGQADVDTHVTDVLDVPTRTMTLDIAVVPGRYFWLGRVFVTGCRARTGDAIAGELAIAPGDLFSTRAIELARARLENLGWFSSVVVSIAHGGDDGTVDVHFEVEENPSLVPTMARR